MAMAKKYAVRSSSLFEVSIHLVGSITIGIADSRTASTCSIVDAYEYALQGVPIS